MWVRNSGWAQQGWLICRTWYCPGLFLGQRPPLGWLRLCLHKEEANLGLFSWHQHSKRTRKKAEVSWGLGLELSHPHFLCILLIKFSHQAAPSRKTWGHHCFSDGETAVQGREVTRPKPHREFGTMSRLEPKPPGPQSRAFIIKLGWPGNCCFFPSRKEILPRG